MRAAGPIEERDRKSGPGISPGDLLLGKYRVERVLGEGSMGTIFAARHAESGQLVALKLLTARALASGQAEERFLREARALARLRGKNVAQVHEIARLPGGAPCMVMEYLHGSDLQAILLARGAAPIRDALDWMIQACQGVAEAHALDIVHRDLKPANLFVTPLPDGRSQVRVLDFGIAKLVERDGPFDNELTHAGMVFGTPSYMSPEQMRQTKDVDVRTDIWSLGVVLYELLTGAVPFAAAPNSGDLVVRVALDTPRRPAELRPDVPPALDAIVMRCLEKKVERRFQTAVELAEALRAVLATLPDERASLLPAPAALPVGDRISSIGGVPASGAPQRRGVPRWAFALSALLLIAAVAAAAVFVGGRDPSPAGAAEGPSGSSTVSIQPPSTSAPTASAPPPSTAEPSSSPPPSAAAPSSSAAPSGAASSSGAPRPAASTGRPTTKSFNACFTTADCRRGKRCIRGWCK